MMANDLVILRCKACGGWKALAKYYPSTGIQACPGVIPWINGHAFVCHGEVRQDLGGDPGFTLHTEYSLQGWIWSEPELPKELAGFIPEGPRPDVAHSYELCRPNRIGYNANQWSKCNTEKHGA